MKHTFYILTVIVFFVIVTAFVKDNNPYFTITSKDIVFTNPKGFPKPYYDFKNNKISIAGFTLGRKLFYDPILSIDNFTSCATCHQQFAAFAHIDHPLSHGTLGRIGKRNVPALQNLIWKDAYMADGGILHLDLQPIAPITSHDEMDEKLSNILLKLNADTSYKMLFYNAFGDSIISTKNMMKSFSQFLSLLISSNSKYDRFIANKTTLSKDEMSGLTLFKSNCASCHTAPLFTDNKYHNTGLTPDTRLDDKGREAITYLKQDYFKFKTPSLRNVEMTYPYMHDGRFKNLKQVMLHYNNVGACAKVKFTEQEQTNIIAFLKTLTDIDFLHDRRFADPNTW